MSAMHAVRFAAPAGDGRPAVWSNRSSSARRAIEALIGVQADGSDGATLCGNTLERWPSGTHIPRTVAPCPPELMASRAQDFYVFVTWESQKDFTLKGGKHNELGTVVLPESILQRWGLDGPA